MTIAIVKYALDFSLVSEDQRNEPEIQLNLEAPCGMAGIFVEYDSKRTGRMRVQSVVPFHFVMGEAGPS